jgi:catechol 2,3-dioxygenase-like lactoylglutathione lyase family enzyme
MLMTARLTVVAAALFVALSPVLALEDTAGVRPAKPAPVLPWSTPVLLVGDLDAAAQWYQTHLGFQTVSDRMDGAAHSLLLSRQNTLVHLRARAVDVTGATEAAGTGGRHQRLSLLVDDVDALVADLQDAGVLVLALPEDDHDGRYRIARITDPDGNEVVLREPLPPGT